MKTTVIENNSNKNGSVTKSVANPVTVEKGMPQFVAHNPVNKDSVKTEAVKEAPKAEPVQTEQKPAEHFKPEPQKQVLSLEGTLKLVEELHRKKIQRDKLKETINNLEGFEFELKDDMDETGGNAYQGCTLVITDDNRQSFTTKNPTIIWTVSQMVNRLCVDKLAEIEAAIQIPA